jgi:mycofactocin precursor
MSERVAIAEITENQAPAVEPELAQDELAQDELAEAELLVEEVSIDGMCGVY